MSWKWSSSNRTSLRFMWMNGFKGNTDTASFLRQDKDIIDHFVVKAASCTPQIQFLRRAARAASIQTVQAARSERGRALVIRNTPNHKVLTSQGEGKCSGRAQREGSAHI
ncbi:hypothetical protein EYF80_044802 [Liparis tanakae]|uniref:Uncharacterized protein n=1 Tax=Liparis tanakae TaxID=230148 RepID=A0A4Z2FUQ2_9TELE|nr:hypothetical protein EYF80_044802 [Liparis tanakae]